MQRFVNASCTLSARYPSNLGTMLRLAACLNVGVDIIEPCGFPLDDKRIKRAGMDYLAAIDFSRHKSWNDFLSLKSGRVILMSTKAQPLCCALNFVPATYFF